MLRPSKYVLRLYCVKNWNLNFSVMEFKFASIMFECSYYAPCVVSNTTLSIDAKQCDVHVDVEN